MDFSKVEEVFEKKGDENTQPMNFSPEMGEGTFICKMDIKGQHKWPNDFYAVENYPDGMLEVEIPSGMKNPFE